MPRFAANLSLLYAELPFLDRFERAARAGFRAVECQFPYEFPAAEIRRRLDEHGLQLVLHNLPPGDWAAGERGLACLPDRVADFRASVERGIDYAQALGVKQLGCLAGIAPGGIDDPRLRATLVDNLRHAAGKLAPLGMRLVVEAINHHDMPGFVLTRSAPTLALLDEVAAPNAFLLYDVYHMQRMEGELAATLQRQLHRIAHIQVADNPGRHEPGSGEINYPFLFAQLDRIGYDGWIGCEYKPLGDTDAGLRWLREAGGLPAA